MAQTHYCKFKHTALCENALHYDKKTTINKQILCRFQKMMKVWKSNLKNHLKIGFFRGHSRKCLLLYGAECWTMTGKMRNRLDGTYTRMLRAVLGVSWKEHKTNNLPKITDTLMIRRLRFIGHCWRKKDEVISDLLLDLGTKARRKKERKTSNSICRTAAK